MPKLTKSGLASLRHRQKALHSVPNTFVHRKTTVFYIETHNQGVLPQTDLSLHRKHWYFLCLNRMDVPLNPL